MGKADNAWLEVVIYMFWSRSPLSILLTELSSLLLYRICNNITLRFSNVIMPVHTLQGIPRTLNASITSMCCSGLQHRISLPLSTFGTQVRKRHDVNDIRDLERALQAEWARIPLQVIRKLICSMRRCCLAVLAANGGHTRYSVVSEFLRLTP